MKYNYENPFYWIAPLLHMSMDIQVTTHVNVLYLNIEPCCILHDLNKGSSGGTRTTYVYLSDPK